MWSRDCTSPLSRVGRRKLGNLRTVIARSLLNMPVPIVRGSRLVRGVKMHRNSWVRARNMDQWKQPIVSSNRCTIRIGRLIRTSTTVKETINSISPKACKPLIRNSRETPRSSLTRSMNRSNWVMSRQFLTKLSKKWIKGRLLCLSSRRSIMKKIKRKVTASMKARTICHWAGLEMELGVDRNWRPIMRRTKLLATTHLITPPKTTQQATKVKTATNLAMISSKLKPTALTTPLTTREPLQEFWRKNERL